MSEIVQVEVGAVAEWLAPDDAEAAAGGETPAPMDEAAFLSLARTLAAAILRQLDPNRRLPDLAPDLACAFPGLPLPAELVQGAHAAFSSFVALPHLWPEELAAVAGRLRPRRRSLVGRVVPCHVFPVDLLHLLPRRAGLEYLRSLRPEALEADSARPAPAPASATPAYVLLLGWREAHRAAEAERAATERTRAEVRTKIVQAGEVEAGKRCETAALQKRLPDAAGVAERTRLQERIDRDRRQAEQARERLERLGLQQAAAERRQTELAAARAPARVLAEVVARLQGATPPAGAADPLWALGAPAFLAAADEHLVFKLMVADTPRLPARTRRPRRAVWAGVAVAAVATVAAVAVVQRTGGAKVAGGAKARLGSPRPGADRPPGAVAARVPGPLPAPDPGAGLPGLPAPPATVTPAQALAAINRTAYDLLAAMHPSHGIISGKVMLSDRGPDGLTTKTDSDLFFIRRDLAALWRQDFDLVQVDTLVAPGTLVRSTCDLHGEIAGAVLSAGHAPSGTFSVEVTGIGRDRSQDRRLLVAYYDHGQRGSGAGEYVAWGPGVRKRWEWQIDDVPPLTLHLLTVPDGVGHFAGCALPALDWARLGADPGQCASVLVDIPEVGIHWEIHPPSLTSPATWVPESAWKTRGTLEVRAVPRAGGSPVLLGRRPITLFARPGQEPRFDLRLDHPVFFATPRGHDFVLEPMANCNINSDRPDYAVVEPTADGFDVYFPMHEVRIGRIEEVEGEYRVYRSRTGMDWPVAAVTRGGAVQPLVGGPDLGADLLRTSRAAGRPARQPVGEGNPVPPGLEAAVQELLR